MQGDRLKRKGSYCNRSCQRYWIWNRPKICPGRAQVVIADVLLEEGQEAAKKIGERVLLLPY